MNDSSTADQNSTILDLRGGFIGNGLPINTNAALMAKIGKVALNAGKSVATEVLAKEFSVDAKEAASYVDTAINIVNMAAGSISSDGNGPTIVVENGSNESLTGTGTRLDYSVAPVEVSLNTGITPNAYADIWRTYRPSYYSPLHLNFCEIKINVTGTDLLSFWSSILNNQFILAVQRAISFSAGSTVTTATNMIAQFNVLIRAMSVYLFWDGVLAYCQNPENRNDGMEAIRAQLTASDINNLNNLRWLLAALPIPPNMRALVYWYYQTYSYSSMPGSPLILNCPESVNSVGVIQNSIGTQITNVSNNNFRETMTLLSKACPNWILGRFDSGNATALHDPNFTTLFSNNPTVGSNSGITPNFWYPLGSDTAIYGTNVNDLDGAVLGLYGFYDSTSQTWLPALTSQNSQAYSTTLCSNKWSWGNGTFVPSFSIQSLSRNRGDVVTQELSASGVTNSKVIPAGFEYLRGIDYISCLQTVTKLLEWMLSIETIGTIVDNKVYGTNKLSRMSNNGKVSPNKSKRKYTRKKD